MMKVRTSNQLSVPRASDIYDILIYYHIMSMYYLVMNSYMFEYKDFFNN